MRLQTGYCNNYSNELREFSEWILKIGDGKAGEPNDGEAIVEIPDYMLIKDSSNPLVAIVESTYPSLLQNMSDENYLQETAILAPTHDIVDMVNEYMLSLIPGEEKIYLSSDSTCKGETSMDCADDMYTPDFLNSVRSSGLPSHSLKFKVGVPVMLLRNVDQCAGLCNGTRLVITQLGKHIIEATVISGSNIGHKVFIPRMILSTSDPRLPFKLQRRQCPLTLCFAMTINKSQGQSLSLSRVGLYLQRPVCSHGQLYVALTRVATKEGLKFLICSKENQVSKTTNNVVFKEIF